MNNWYEEMTPVSLVSKGNNKRLEKVLKKLADGKPTTVAFLGGSITEGAGATEMSDSYADRVAGYLKETYANAEITYVNAGLGGTPSPLGIMRYQRDVLDKATQTPDLFFLEFAVNDNLEVTDGRAYESLIRTMLESSSDAAVVLVFSVFMSKWNMQDIYIPVGEHYGLPMVSIKNFTDLAYEKGKLTDEEYFADEFHPTSYGHKIMADCIAYLLAQAASGMEEAGETKDLPSDTVKGGDFRGTVLLTSENTAGKDEITNGKLTAGDFCGRDKEVQSFMRTGKSSFPDNWMYEGNGKNQEFKLSLACKNILLDFKLSNQQEFGTAQAFVDGNHVMDMEGYSEGGWNNSNVVLILDEKECAEHELVIKMKDGDEDKKFTILAIGYSK